MGKPKLLEGEELMKTLKPHPVSFSHQFALPFTIALYGMLLWWLFNLSGHWDGVTDWWLVGDVSQPAAYVVWYLGVLLAAVVASVVLIQWSLFFVALGGLVAGTVVLFMYGGGALPEDPFLFIPMWTMLGGLAGVLLAELNRQSHRYDITNYRIIFRGGLLKTHERTLRYAKITDVDGQQSFVGRILGYGTILPITGSGFGLGSDSSFAALGAGAKAGKGGAGVGIGAGAGGGREVQTPRARTYYALHGAWPYGRTKHLIENMVQENTDVPYLRDQADTLKRIEAALTGKKPDEDE